MTSISPRMQETFAAGGKPIRIEVHEPSQGPNHAQVSSNFAAILLLHGAGGHIGFWLDRIAPPLLAAGVALYAPHYFDRTGTQYADLATIADGIHAPQWLDTIAASLRWIGARPGVDTERIALVGISLGSFLSLSLAATNSASNDPAVRQTIRCLVDISGGLPEPYSRASTSQFPPTLILHGAADSVVPVSHAHQLDRLLTELSVPHETRILQGQGHWFSSSAQMELLLSVSSFLSKHLATASTGPGTPR